MARGGVDLGKEVEEKLHEFITYLKQKKSVDCLSLRMEAPNYAVCIVPRVLLYCVAVPIVRMM